MVEVIYLHKKDFVYKSNKGLAEKLVRKEFVKKGYFVWKGEYLQFLGSEDYYLYQKDRYELLLEEIKARIGNKRFWRLILWIKANAGIPDFVMKRNGELFFVEVKLNNESIKRNQLDTIIFLKELNLKTIIVRVSDNKRIFRKELDLITGRSYLKSYIPKLRMKW